MALLNPTFFLGLLVLLYLSSFVLFAVIRILTGLSIQRIGYLSLRRLAYTPRDGLTAEIRGLGLHIHRPTFAQPAWVSLVLSELVVTIDTRELQGRVQPRGKNGEPDAPAPLPRTQPARPGSQAAAEGDTWKQVLKLKERIKTLHQNIRWLRMVDIVATNSAINVLGVGSVQVGSFTIAVDTRPKIVDRARFFFQKPRSSRGREHRQAEWIITLRSLLFTADGNDSLEVLDHALLNIHELLNQSLDGLRDATVALKLGRVHIPYDDLEFCAARLRERRRLPETASSLTSDEADDIVVLPPAPQDTTPNSDSSSSRCSSNDKKEQAKTTASNPKALLRSILRCIKEVQFAVSFAGLSKKMASIKPDSNPILLNASMKEVGIDIHRLDPKSPAHRMYFISKDIAHEALAAALSISVGLDDGQGKLERLVYIPMATTTVRTTLPSSTIELAQGGSLEEKDANVLFANSVVTSPSVDLEPRHLPVLIALMRPQPQPWPLKQRHEGRHGLISRLLPKANVKFSMHEPVVRIKLRPLRDMADVDDFDLIISSISSVSLDVDASHSPMEDMHYSLDGATRLQSHRLYYQTCSGDIFNLMTTESLDLKAQLAATPEVCVNVSGNIQSFSVSMVRQEITDGLRQIVRQLHIDVEPERRVRPAKTAGRQNFLRSVPEWLVRCRFEASDFNVEVAGVDENMADDTRGACLHLDSFSAEYHTGTLDGPQPQPARRRTHSRSVNQSDSDLAPSPTSPRFRRKTQNTGDGRRLALFARGLEAQIVEAADRLEVEPFVSVPRLDLVFSASSDSHGPLFHIQSLVRSIMVQYSLYRHYAVGIAIMTLRKAFFMRRIGEETAPQPRQPSSYLSPYSMATSPRLPDVNGGVLSTVIPEVVTVDVKASLVQIKAKMMHEPLMMLHVFGLETGRHRWSTPYLSSKLVRLYVESPRMRITWARIISVKNGRVDLRESRRKTALGGLVEEKMIDMATENVRIAVPHEVVVHRIMDNVVNTTKTVQQLHHRFKTGINEYILEKGPQDPKQVPKLSIRARNLLLELEDGAFEWKLGIIYRTGRLEQLQRLTRQEAFRVKSKRVRDEASRRGSKARSRSALPRGRTDQSSSSRLRSRSLDSLDRQDTLRGSGPGLIPRYDPDGASASINGQAKVSEDEARAKLDLLNAQSWKRRIDGAYKAAQSRMREIRSAFWGSNQLADDVEMTKKLLEVPRRPALMSAMISDFHLTLDKPAFAMQSLPDFMHDVGKGMPRDMQYSLLVPMHVAIGMGEVRVSLRDYPLPCLHIPGLRAGQSSRVPSVSLKANLVVAEELRDVESTRRVRVDVVRSRNPEAATSSEGGGFAIDVRRTISPLKSFSEVYMDINTALPTRITWGPCYQPAMQDMMMVVESFTKPQVDPSERVGFWDKIRLNTHSRIRVAWKGDGEMHLSLKGTRDPYQVSGNGAGFLMCWRSNVRWNINAEDNPKRFMTVDSGEYMLAIPDYSHLVRAAAWREDGHDDGGSAKGEAGGAMFKKVVMKLSGKVQWMAGLVFERAIEHGRRSFTFKPHYQVVLKNPAYAAPDHEALHGFRSRHVHLSITVRAPADGEWPSTQTSEATGSYNSVHLTPRFFTHFFQWWGLFSQPMSLPIRQGSLFPGREKNSKKFGRHLATVKYSLLLAPLFLSHIYRHKDVEDQADGSGGGASATGLKVRLDSFMLDLHQRREEFGSLGRGRNAANRRSGIKIHAAQLDLASADVRAVSASLAAAAAAAAAEMTAEAGSSSSSSKKPRDQRPDLARFTLPDNDHSWIDMDDFVELDWMLPTEAPAETKILPLAYAPRLTYVRQTDIGGTIAGDPTRTSPFGDEPTHLCMMSHDDEPKRVQWQLIQERLDQLEVQMLTHSRNAGEAELRMIQTNAEDAEIVDDFEALRKHTGVLREKKVFLEGLLEQMKARGSGNSNGYGGGSGSMPDIPSTAEFDSDFSNRFVVHNMQLKWNNVLRNIVLRYSHQNSQRRGFIYYLSQPAVKFILDMVEEQNKAKSSRPAAAQTGAASKTTGTSSPAGGSNMSEREAAHNLEEHVKRMLNDGHRRVVSGDGTLEDLESGISRDYSPQRGYHVRVIAPQMQLQSEKNKKHVVLVTAKGMELKVLEVMDKERISDPVSGLVQRRFLANLDSTQFFVTHQKWFSTKLVSMYAGSRYGAPHGSAWPPWVPMEIMFNFTADPFGFKRVVQNTSAMLRYDKYNNLRLKYDEEVNTDAGAKNEGHKSEPAVAAEAAAVTVEESRSDSLWIEFPQARALCNSSQYYALYVIVLDLLMYSEPLEKRHNERLEKIILASDFSDLSGAPQMVQQLQERIKQLEEICDHFQLYVHRLDRRGWADRQTLERDLAACEDELFFLMKAITTSQRRGGGDDTSPLLKWTISAREIVWHLVLNSNEPLVELQLKNVEYDRTDRADGSHANLMRVGKVLGLNLLADATYPEMVAPYHGDEKAQASEERDMLRMYWHKLEAIAGIPVMDRFEVHLFPIKVQLEREIGKRLFDYIFPGMDSGGGDKSGDKNGEKGGSASATSRNQSPYMIKHEPVNDEDSESLASLGSRLSTSLMDSRDAPAFATRAGSLELRLQPTLTSNAATTAERSPKKATASSGSGEGGHGFRLFRSGGTVKLIASKKPSYDSLRPGTVARSSTGLSSKDGRDGDGRKGSARFGLRGKGGPSSSSDDKKQQQQQPPHQQRRERRAGQQLDDDLSQMMTRASSYVTYAHIHMPSVVLCLSYKGREQRNFEDVHDFVFRLPEMEWQNKTWSNLDLALALKKAVVKALIAHTGAIIGNKFSKHRPNAEQRSKLRELASSSALISSTPGPPGPGLSSSPASSSAAASLLSQQTLYSGRLHNDSDDSSSVYVDYSRSPPRATSVRAGSTHSSIPAPAAASASVSAQRRTASRSSSAASGGSRRTGGSATATSVPTQLTMTPQPPGSEARDEVSASQQQRSARGMGLLRPSSSGTGAPAHHRRALRNVGTPDNRPSTSAGHLDAASAGDRRRTTGCVLRDKIIALTHRRSTRESSGGGGDDGG